MCMHVCVCWGGQGWPWVLTEVRGPALVLTSAGLWVAEFGPEQERMVWVSPGLHESGVGVA